MKNKTRIITTIVLIASIIMVFVSAYIIKNSFLVLIFAIIEICAYIWYELSLIPFGKKLVK